MISGEDLAAYVAGDAGPALVARVEAAMSDDPSVGRRVEAIRAVDDQLARWEPPMLGVAGVDRLDASVDALLAAVLGPVDSSAGGTVEAPTGGVHAAGSRSAGRGLVERLGTWWRGQVGRRDLVGLVGGVAVAAVVVVIGVGVAGDLFGTGDEDSAAETTMMDAGSVEAGAGGDAGTGGGEGFASGGTESMASAESMEPEEDAVEDVSAQSEARDDPAVVDNGRVVAALGDVDPAALRDRLEPLVGLREGATEAAAADEAEPLDDAADTGTDGSPSTPPLADAQVDADDVGAVEVCLPAGPGLPIVAEVVVLAPGRDVILYLYDDRVVAVDVDDCSTLAVRLG